MRSYVICAEPRSGSNLLAEALRATNRAGDPDEWYDIPFLHQRLAKFGLAAPSSTPLVPIPVDGSGYLAELQANTSIGNYFGIKIHHHQYLSSRKVGLDDLFDTLIARSDTLMAILLTRKNKIRQAVSTYIAAHTGIYFIREGETAIRNPLRYKYWSDSDAPGPPLTNGVVPFDFDEIDAIVEQVRTDELAWRHLVAEKGIASCQISYDDLINKREETLRIVFRFLGIDVQSVAPTKFVRQATELNERFVHAYERENFKRRNCHIAAAIERPD